MKTLLALACALYCAIPASLLAQAPATTPKPAVTPTATPIPEPPLDWHDVTEWGVEGRSFVDQPRFGWFDRLPKSAQGKVTDKVWGLSRDSSGMVVHFKTNSPAIWAHYKLRTATMASPNMTAIGASGLDLYARDEAGKWRWAGVAKPDKQEVRQPILSDLAPGEREYACYLPLYNGLDSLSLGVAAGAKFEGVAPRSEKPIVFYGTSITQGASASRPGMVHTAILGRHLNLPVINLGFSGNGKMDEAVGEYLVQIDAAVYVIDCLPNMTPEEVRQKCGPLVHQIRKERPETPILLVEDRRWTNTWIRPSRQKFHDENHAALKESYAALQKEGVAKLYYLPGDGLLGDDDEAGTDGSHPSDLGFVRQTAAFEPVLRQALGL
jgi:hypothetical protein